MDLEYKEKLQVSDSLWNGEAFIHITILEVKKLSNTSHYNSENWIMKEGV